jgi:hypothetical protein
MDYDSTKPDRATIQFNLSARKILNKAGNFRITPPNFIGISHFYRASRYTHSLVGTDV